MQPIACDEPVPPPLFPPLPDLDLGNSSNSQQTASSSSIGHPASQQSFTSLFLQPIGADEPIPPKLFPPLPANLDLTDERF